MMPTSMAGKINGIQAIISRPVVPNQCVAKDFGKKLFRDVEFCGFCT